MITCPNCGAGNKPGTAACRMCATSLQGIAEAPAARIQPPAPVSPAGATPGGHHKEEAKAPVEQEGVVCSECNTLNEVGWLFCQQCGKRLAQPQPQPPPPAAQPPAETPPGFTTVPDQLAVVDPGSAESFRTVVAKPPQIDHDFKTVVDVPPPPERDYRTVVAMPPPPVDQEAKTLRQPKRAESVVAPEPPAPPPPAAPPPPPRVVEPPVVEPPVTRPSAPPAPPQVVEPPPVAPPPPVVEPPRVVAPQVQPPRAAAPAPPHPKPAAPPPPPAPKPAAPPEAPALEPATLPGQAVSGVLCSQCGQSSNVGSAFCASCGAPITYGKTMVISSHPTPDTPPPPPPPPKGRLNLVMEGGQAGEVYELEGDTVIGRSNGKITFPHDGFMSGRHARVELRGTSFVLTDEGSRNGTFIKIKGEVELKPGDTILVGKQLFRFEIVE